MDSKVSVCTTICFVVFAMLIMHIVTVAIDMYHFHVIRALDAFFMEEAMRLGAGRYESFGEGYVPKARPSKRPRQPPRMPSGYSYEPEMSSGYAMPDFNSSAWSPVTSELPIAVTGVDSYQQSMAQVEGTAYEDYPAEQVKPGRAYPESIVRGRGPTAKNINTFYF